MSNSVTAEDGDGVWSPDIEEAFEEALKIYPPCGRRKIILSEEGKMYGRNELIARYIKMKTGKIRSRKQVSSHIQVLARKKQRELQNQLKTNPEAAEKLAETLKGLSSAEIVSSTLAGQNAQGRAERSMTFGGTPSQRETASGNNAASGIMFPDAYHQQQGGSAHMQGSASFGSEFSSPQRHSSMSDYHHHRQSPQQQQQQQQQQHQDEQHLPSPFAQQNMSPSRMAQSITYNGIARLRLAMDYFSAGVTYPFQQGVHKFFELSGSYHFADPSMECVDLFQVLDKFPQLEELYRAGPKEAFFLAKVWVDLGYDAQQTQSVAHEDENGNIDPQPNDAVFNLATRFESLESMPVECRTSAISLGNVAAEKIQTQAPRYEGGRFLYDFTSGTMCEYMTQFIAHLHGVSGVDLINLVLENFAVLQVIRNASTGEVLFSSACLFEAVPPGADTGVHVYKLLDMREELSLRRNTA